MSSRDILVAAGVRFSRKAVAHIEKLCGDERLKPRTWFRWWLETRASVGYDNIVMSPKTDAAFREWLSGEKRYALERAERQVEAFRRSLKDSAVPVETALGRRIRGVGPLVHFTLGRYLDCPQSVEWLRDAAVEQAADKPWEAGVLEKYKQYLPEGIEDAN